MTTTPAALQRTPFYQAHLDANGKIVDFFGWELPIHYGSQLDEHNAVRSDAGMFDVSHMVITDVSGAEAKPWLQKLLANDVAKLKTVGKALYSAMLNDDGGIIDDLIVYRMNESETEYRIVSNAATRDKDLAQFHAIAQGFKVELSERPELAMLAVQGPNAIAKLSAAKPAWADRLTALKPFVGADLSAIEGATNQGGEWFVARTGYTGEDGVEVMLQGDDANDFFKLLIAHGIAPAGLGARDTLRLEAGMNLYGQDMDESVSPYECNMAWTLALKDARDFVGRQALVAKQAAAKAAGTAMQQVGLVLEGRGVLRAGMAVAIDSDNDSQSSHSQSSDSLSSDSLSSDSLSSDSLSSDSQGSDSKQTGIITSGTFSPSLKHSIAIARIPASVSAANSVQVDLRGKGQYTKVRVVKLPFVRNGSKQFD